MTFPIIAMTTMTNVMRPRIAVAVFSCSCDLTRNFGKMLMRLKGAIFGLIVLGKIETGGVAPTPYA